MSIESKLRTYLAALDGTAKDFSSVEHLFEDLYHSEFVLEDNDNSADRNQIKRIQSKAFELGSKATLLKCSTSTSTIEYMFNLSNEQWDMVIHCVADIKGNKLYRAQPVEGTKPLLLRNLEAYIAAFDGTSKDISVVSHLFEQIYHDHFVYQADGNPIDKTQIKQYQSDFFALGSKATLLVFKEVAPDTVEFKFRMVNDKVDVIVHNVASVQNNKFITSESVDEASAKSVSNIRDVCETYESEMTSTVVDKLPFVKAEEGDAVISAPQ